MVVDAGSPHLLLDVREPVEFKICQLKRSRSIHNQTIYIRVATSLHGDLSFPNLGQDIPLTSLQRGSEGLKAVAKLIEDLDGDTEQPGIVALHILAYKQLQRSMYLSLH